MWLTSPVAGMMDWLSMPSSIATGMCVCMGVGVCVCVCSDEDLTQEKWIDILSKG